MITKAHITRRAAQDNVPAVTVERDYVLAHVIAGAAVAGLLVGCTKELILPGERARH